MLKRSKFASFRGVKFCIESHEHETGRRSAKHEYPKLDDAFVEDLGRKTREFMINGFVFGRTCANDRDRLLTACEGEGGGELIHPHYGKKTVVCTGCRVSESALERGIIYFTLQFTESGPEVQIDLLPSFFKNLAAFDLIDQVTAFIEENYDTLEGSVGTLSAVTELFEKSLSPVVAMNSSLASFNSDQTDFKNHLKDFSREPGKCMRFFAELFSSFSKPDTPPAPLIAPIHHAFSKKNVLGSDTPIESITPEQREKLDVIGGVRLIALSTVLQSESFSEDLEDSDVETLLQIIDESLEETVSDDIFLALQRLRASLLTLLHSLSHRRRDSLILPISIPSLALCYKIYGTLEKEDELLTLNPTSNPCFIGPGVIRYGI